MCVHLLYTQLLCMHLCMCYAKYFLFFVIIIIMTWIFFSTCSCLWTARRWIGLGYWVRNLLHGLPLMASFGVCVCVCVDTSITWRVGLVASTTACLRAILWTPACCCSCMLKEIINRMDINRYWGHRWTNSTEWAQEVVLDTLTDARTTTMCMALARLRRLVSNVLYRMDYFLSFKEARVVFLSLETFRYERSACLP